EGLPEVQKPLLEQATPAAQGAEASLTLSPRSEHMFAIRGILNRFLEEWKEESVPVGAGFTVCPGNRTSGESWSKAAPPSRALSPSGVLSKRLCLGPPFEALPH